MCRDRLLQGITDSRFIIIVLGSTLEKVFGKINETVSNIVNPGEGKKNNTLIESVFANGAFLNNKAISFSVNAMIEVYNNTMVCITSREALKKGLPTNAHH